jgi:rhodanese-related sulfurtransferase
MSNRISRDELQTLEASGRPPAIIDVRDRDEYVAGHLPGAIYWR